MESKFRRLYLYATSKQPNTKKPGESLQEFRLKKQKSIEHLKQLLQLKIVDKPLQNTSKDIKQEQEEVQSNNWTPQPSLSIIGDQSHQKTSPKLSIKKQNFKKSPSIAEYLEEYRKEKISRNRKKQREYLYEKYVNQYMEKIYEENLLEKYPEEDYSRLVQQASREIREKVNQILQNEGKGMDKQKSTDSHIGQILKDNSRKQSCEKESGRGGSLEEGLVQRSQKKEKYRKLSVNNQKRSRSVAENNIYKLNLEKIEKINKLKVKARKRSQRQFIRNLGKNKFVSTMTLPLI